MDGQTHWIYYFEASNFHIKKNMCQETPTLLFCKNGVLFDLYMCVFLIKMCFRLNHKNNIFGQNQPHGHNNGCLILATWFLTKQISLRLQSHIFNEFDHPKRRNWISVDIDRFLPNFVHIDKKMAQVNYHWNSTSGSQVGIWTLLEITLTLVS